MVQLSGEEGDDTIVDCCVILKSIFSVNCDMNDLIWPDLTHKIKGKYILLQYMYILKWEDKNLGAQIPGYREFEPLTWGYQQFSAFE